MGMMEMTIDQIVDVVPVRHRFMAAVRTVNVTCVMRSTSMIRSAGGGVGPVLRERVLVDVIAVDVVKMPVV